MTETLQREARRVVFAAPWRMIPALVLDRPTNSLDVRALREVRDRHTETGLNGVTLSW